MFSRQFAFFAAIFASLAACSAPPVEQQRPPEEQPSSTPPPVAAAAPENLIAGQTDFAVDLYRRIGAKPGNVFLSPASISAALGMVYAGAEGQTAVEMAQALRYPAGDIHALMGSLLRKLPIDAEGRVVRIANALWVQEDFGLQPDYLGLVNHHYGGAASPVDFVGAPEQAVGTINAWAEEKTAGRIKGLLKRSNITADTRLILTNSIYFKGDWLKPFRANQTRTQPFLLPGGRSVPATFMRQRNNLRVLRQEDFQALEAPYVGEELSMILFVPERVDGLAAFESELDGGKLAGWTDALMNEQPSDVELIMPKIELTTKASLVPELQALGMRRAFTNSAQFGGIAETPLRVSDVIHQTFLLVDEKGTEAAAVTAPIMEIVSMPRQFHADRPFLFIIRDNRTKTILFIGRISDPATML